MGVYNFEKRFVPMILDHRKTHTIRNKRRHPDRPGSTLYLYTGLRRKGATLLIDPAPICKQVQDIIITAEGRVYIDREELDKGERNALARSDGFADFADMMKFWEGGANGRRLPFEGHLIHW